MACGTVVGSALEFGISHDEASLVAQSVSVKNKSDKKEARDKCGIVVAVAFYNKMSEISIEGLGRAALAVGATLSLSGTYLTLAGTAYVDDVSVAKANEDYVKSTINATAYEGIGGAS